MFRTIHHHIHLRSTQLLRSLPRTAIAYPTTIPAPTPIVPENLSSNTPKSPSLSTTSSPFSSTHNLWRRHQEENEEINGDPKRPPKLFIVQPRLRPEPVLQAKLQEALNLANSLEEHRDGYYETEFLEKDLPPHVVVQNPLARSPRADTYFRTGTVDDVKCRLNALESGDGVDAIFVNATLTGIQQRNLERAWGKPVMDRVGLIIEIFNAHAQTKEAKLQAELAALMYKRSRLVRVRGPGGRSTFGAMGEAEVVSARGRGSGGRGFIGGAGETELQLQKRRILERRIHLLAEIKEVRRTRALQRAARKRHGGADGEPVATVAVVGYTNAGKSTLVSALSDSYLYSDDRLFATVDPKLRSVVLPSGRKVLLSDTVGFISDLPVQLVEAFHATLEEVVEADLLVHVLDSSSSNLEEQRETVLQVLEQIGVSEDKLRNMIEVWNKIDLQDNEFHCDEEVDSFSGSEEEEDDDVELSCSDMEHTDTGNKQMSELSGNVKERVDDGEGNYSKGWLSSGDELDSSWVDYKGSSVGQGTSDGVQKWTPRNWRFVTEDPESQQELNPRIRTSALTGVGLQELLEVIDERLQSQNEKVFERSIFHSKWRPPRSEDSNIAAEQ